VPPCLPPRPFETVETPGGGKRCRSCSIPTEAKNLRCGCQPRSRCFSSIQARRYTAGQQSAPISGEPASAGFWRLVVLGAAKPPWEHGRPASNTHLVSSQCVPSETLVWLRLRFVVKHPSASTPRSDNARRCFSATSVAHYQPGSYGPPSDAGLKKCPISCDRFSGLGVRMQHQTLSSGIICLRG
jgi:hypothetical protein